MGRFPIFRVAGKSNVARSAGASSPGEGSNDGLASKRCPLPASLRTTRSLSSSGGKRTRIAISKPSRITSTHRLVLSRSISTFGHSAMKRAIKVAVYGSARARDRCKVCEFHCGQSLLRATREACRRRINAKATCRACDDDLGRLKMDQKGEQMKLAMFNERYWLHDASLLDFGFETGKITFRTELCHDLGMPGPLPPPGTDDYATGIVEISGVHILDGDPQAFAKSVDGEILSLLLGSCSAQCILEIGRERRS